MTESRTYNNSESLWNVIDSMVEMLNVESVRKEYINPNTEISVGYTMSDIAFDHTIELKDGFVHIKEGLHEENHVVIDISSQDFHDLNMGSLNPTLALIQKRIKFLKGDIKQVILAGNMPTMVYYKEAYKKIGEKQ